jgi:integrase
MPKYVNRVPTPRLHKPSGQARIRYNGKDVYLGRYGSVEARLRYREFLAQLKTAPPPSPTAVPVAERVTVGIAVWRYWQWAEVRYRDADGKPTRGADEMRIALRPLRRMFGDLELEQLGPSKLIAVRESMIGQGLARRTINGRIGKLRRFAKWCVARELVSGHVLVALAAVEPLRAGQGGRETPGRRRPIPWSMVEATLPHLPPLTRALARFVWFTGCRVGEARILTTGMIDRSGPVWRASLDKHKTAYVGKERIILIGPEAQAAILPWLRLGAPDRPVFSPRCQPCPGIAKNRGRRAPGDSYARPSLPQAIRRACNRAFPHPSLADVKPKDLTEADRAELRRWRNQHHWSLAQLRHSRATELRERFGVDVAQAVLGHSRPDMTAHYSREAIAHAVEAMKSVG